MYSRKNLGPRMDPWGTPALTEYSCEDVPSRTTQITEKRRNKARYQTWNSIKTNFVKRTSMPNTVKSLGYIKCYSSSSPWSLKSPSNSTRYDCQKIWSWSRRPTTILKTRKKSGISLGDQQSYYCSIHSYLNYPTHLIMVVLVPYLHFRWDKLFT